MTNTDSSLLLVRVLAALAIGLAQPSSGADVTTERTVAGYVESVVIEPGRLSLAAKLDTGADHSSIHATDITTFEREGKPWVSFRVRTRDGQPLVLERPIVRNTRIKNIDGDSLKRHVVMLGVCLGTIYRETQFNLADRSGFKYGVLLGRSFLAGRLIVDPELQNTTRPSCAELGP